jgi:transposase InsO family protein
MRFWPREYGPGRFWGPVLARAFARFVDAELRHRGIVVNAKKIRRLMREHALNPRQRRRFIATTDSDHNYPIFPNLAKNTSPARRAVSKTNGCTKRVAKNAADMLESFIA